MPFPFQAFIIMAVIEFLFTNMVGWKTPSLVCRAEETVEVYADDVSNVVHKLVLVVTNLQEFGKILEHTTK